MYSTKTTTVTKIASYISVLDEIRKLQLKNIVPILHLNHTDDYMAIITPRYYISLDKLCTSAALAQYNNYEMLKDICTGLLNLHENKKVHGNLHPANIVFCKEDNHWYLMDYNKHKLYSTPSNMINYQSISYVSPELILDNEVDKESDVWSFGCLFYYVMNSAECAFRGKTMFEIANYIITCKYDKIKSRDEKAGVIFTKLLRKILCCPKENRLSIKEILTELDSIYIYIYIFTFILFFYKYFFVNI